MYAIEHPSSITPSPGYAPGQSGLMPSPARVENSGLMPSPVSIPISVAAVSQAPAPPPQVMGGRGTLPSLPLGVAGAAPTGPTHVSAQRPPGTPPVHGYTPSIAVVAAPRLVGAPWWVVGVVGFVAFGLGLAVGLLLG
jgi:hypothetical protein